MPAEPFGPGRGAVFPAALARRLVMPGRLLLHPPGRLARRLDPRPDDRLLELGCGPGWFSASLLRSVPGGVLVLADLQPAMLVLARDRAGAGPSTPAVALHAGALPLRARSVDAAVLTTVLGEVDDQEQALGELARVLRPGGRLLVLESRTDPDFVPLGRLERLGRAAGFGLERRWGWPGYTARFRR
jgi:ubiquinone/menaquinone biosynthesis C-methylase UbiE